MSDTILPLLGSTPCGCGRCGRVDTERVVVTDDLAGAARAELDDRAALLFVDPRTREACGSTLADALAILGVDVAVVDLEIAGTSLHPDAAAVRRASGRLAAAPGALPLAVGSGTINDVVKAAAHDLGRPYVAVATAASMNGYTSAIAAITRDGLKRTVPSTPPLAVLAAPAVLARAPRRLTVSGLADLLSKPVSSADWRLAHLLWDEPYCPVPADLAGRAVERAVGVAGGIGRGDPDATLELFEALLMSGISMAVAGSSSPASGGEHLISHYLDMTAADAPGGAREPALHGEQVGVATRISTRLYRTLLELGEREIDWSRAEREAPGPDALPRRLARAPWIGDGLRAGILRQGEIKLERLGDAAARVRAVRERWEMLRESLAADVRSALAFLPVLPSIGAPVRAADVGVSPTEMRAAYHLARWIRDRYTVLDLAGDLGLLEVLEDEVLEGIA